MLITMVILIIILSFGGVRS